MRMNSDSSKKEKEKEGGGHGEGPFSKENFDRFNQAIRDT